MTRKKQKLTEEVKVDEKKKAAIYCRVSTNEQGESGLSLDYQKEKCSTLCAARDWDIFSFMRKLWEPEII